MSQTDFSSTAHRLDNLVQSLFVQGWARVRHHVFHPEHDDLTAAFLRGYMESIEQGIARTLGVTESTLVGRLVDLGRDLCEPKDAKDEAE